MKTAAMFATKTMSQYLSEQDGAWRLWFWRDLQNRDVWPAVRDRLAMEPPQRHPRTLEFRLVGAEQRLFLKIFSGTFAWTAIKDVFRRSKAVRSLMLTDSLGGLGFNTPFAIAAGEERHGRILRRSFVVTLAVSGCPLPVFLRDHFAMPSLALPLGRKRKILACLAREIKRFHDLGFIHGDLVPGNIFVSGRSDGTVRFFFMDNDRTHRCPTWLAHGLWKRNLVQLNRVPLAGVSLQDRMRFFHAYTGRKKLGLQDRRLVKWLERKTRQRRRACDAVDVSGSFRRLMRWDATTN